MTDVARNPTRAVDPSPTGDEQAIIPPAPESAEILISDKENPKYAGDPDVRPVASEAPSGAARKTFLDHCNHSSIS
jgi:hypothetical protein